MAWDQFKHRKRQKELAKRQKAEEKRLRRLARRSESANDDMSDAEPVWQSSE